VGRSKDCGLLKKTWGSAREGEGHEGDRRTAWLREAGLHGAKAIHLGFVISRRKEKRKD
jgi:hypothetical protein